MPSIAPEIFRAYDIRGTAHGQLTEDACRLIGQGFGTVVRRTTKKDHPVVIVGRDARTHSLDLENAVVEGLMSTGCTVHLIGETPSPVNYFTICNTHADGGVQVTASHNPKEDNGLKLQLHDAEAYSGDDLQQLREQIEQKDFVTGSGIKKEIDAITPYLTFLSDLFGTIGNNLSVVIDGGNGIAGPVNCRALRATGAIVHELYTEPDGEFPNHPADPSKHSTLKELQAMVLEKKADLGFAFDGDGDRLGIVDAEGVIRSADEILLLLAKDHLSRHPHSPVIFTVSNSGMLETEIKKWGGKPVMCKVGHSFVEHAMREHGSKLGGEQSGHFFCGEEYFGFDDALVAGLRILQIMSKSGNPMSALMKDFPKVYQAPELRPHCPDHKKTNVIASVTQFFAKTYPVLTLDGVRIDFGKGSWAGIRQSNTSPCLSICMEARSPEQLKKIEGIVLDHLKTYQDIAF